MKIRRVKYVSGTVKWQLDYGLVTQPDGSRRRKQVYFSTRDEAQAVMVAEKAKRQQHGDSALALPPDVRIRFLAAEARLAAAGGTIEAAVELFLRHSKAMREPMELGRMLELCLVDKERLGKRPRYLQQLKCSCLNFIRGRESQLSHTVTRAELEKWVHGNGWKPKTQAVYMGDLRALFSWGVTKGFLAENPVNAGGTIELAEPEEAEISRLSLAEVTRLLRFCARKPGRGREDFRSLLWYLVIGLFAGVRPKELERMKREKVSLDEGHVIVEADQAKTRKRRVVDLSAEAVRWLALDLRRKGRIAPVNFERRWKRFREAAGLMPWPHDVLRHTFASMHYAAHQDESLLKAQLGHSEDEDTLMQHYRALATRREAAFFWALKPSARREAAEIDATGARREAPPTYGYWKRVRAGSDVPPVGHTPR